MIVRDIEDFKIVGANQGGYGAGELVVLKPELDELGGFERGRDRTGEFVVGQMNLLQGGHALEGIFWDLTRELIAGQIQGLESTKLPPIGHHPLKAIVHEAKGPQETQGRKRIDVDLTLEAHILELQAPHVAVEAEDADPVALIPRAWCRFR